MATNAGALFACERFVSHVTGTVTRIGVDSAGILALDYALVLAAFISGAMSAILVARKSGDATMGMQNAALAASTAMTVRTTHMTGPATDLGIAFAMLLSGTPSERVTARSSLLLRGTKLFAFIVGGAAMAVLCPRIQYAAFLVPAVASLIATVSSYAPWQQPTAERAT